MGNLVVQAVIPTLSGKPMLVGLKSEPGQANLGGTAGTPSRPIFGREVLFYGKLN